MKNSVLLCMVLLLVAGCQKNSAVIPEQTNESDREQRDQVRSFFEYRGNNTITQAVISALSKRDSVDPTFVNRFMAYEGIPYWDEALVLPYDDKGGVGVMVPVTDGNILKGVFMGYYRNDSTRLRVDYLPKNDNTYNKGDDFTILCNYFSWRIQLFDALSDMEFELIKKSFETTMTKCGTIDGGCIDAVTCVAYRPRPPHSGFVVPSGGGSTCPSIGGIGNNHMNQIDKDANSSDYSPEEEDKAEECAAGGLWWGTTHNKIIDDAFNSLPKSQLDAIKAGSEYADLFQDPIYNYIHCLRNPDQSIEEALYLMREYFIENAMSFVANSNYLDLGKALHPIMDAYTPSHKGFQTFDGFWDYRKHATECHQMHPAEASMAIVNISSLYDKLKNLNYLTERDVYARIFDKWFAEYKLWL